MSESRTSRKAAAAAWLVAGIALAPSAGVAEHAPTTVLELFTSQGCSVCPPADALFAQFAKRPDILALTFNVDYWDYLGWKDTLANADNTDRQKQYAAARGDMQVYTPQVVVDGRTHVIGSDPKQVDKAITANTGLVSIPLTLSSSTDAITVTVASAPRADLPHATLWLVMYNPSVSVTIDRGENGGKTLTYSQRRPQAPADRHVEGPDPVGRHPDERADPRQGDPRRGRPADRQRRRHARLGHRCRDNRHPATARAGARRTGNAPLDPR